METITLKNDIKVFYVTAKSFPEGIPEALEKLHALIPEPGDRSFFGLSRPEQGPIVYRAAAEEIEPGEAEALKCRTIIIKKGNYISLTIHDYMNNLMQIGCSFRDLLAHPGLDPDGYCVEWYLNDKEMKCMVRLDH
ncbi:MAG: transcriptional regulator [Mucilaginibacter sp.]